jgi:hypothetical protein
MIYRAWEKEKGWFISPEFFNQLLLQPDGKVLWWCAESGFEDVTDRIDIQLYTGLKDSEGVELYEGDIVDFTYWWFDGNVAESHLIGELVYLPDCMSFGLKHVKNSEWCNHTGADVKVGDTHPFSEWLFDGADFLKIGTAYENPELI